MDAAATGSTELSLSDGWLIRSIDHAHFCTLTQAAQKNSRDRLALRVLIALDSRAAWKTGFRRGHTTRDSPGWSYDRTTAGQRRRAQSQTPETTPAAAASAKRSYPLMTRLGVKAWWSSSEAP